ncbi:hypothetical protein JXB41_03125 [Candidatus Woesearchaeota archaeon]|nr:hypothetical protein [Candidatus Woesearchaeota archaeon]
MIKKRINNKKSVSPLIAVVLVIAFTVALGAILMTWGRGFITSQTENVESETSKQTSCALDVSLSWIKSNNIAQVCYINDSLVGPNATLRMVISNIGAKEISGIKVQVIEKDGDVLNIENNTNLLEGNARKYEFGLESIDSFSGINYIGVIPKIDVPGSPEDILCTNTKLEIAELNECES